MTWAGASLRPKKTQTHSPGIGKGSPSSRRCRASVRSPRMLPVQSLVPEGLRRLPRRLGTCGGGGAGAARKGGKNKEEEGAGLCLAPPCQGHRRGGAASFPRIGLSAPGAGRRSSSPVPLPSSGRPPGLSKPRGGREAARIS